MAAERCQHGGTRPNTLYMYVFCFMFYVLCFMFLCFYVFIFYVFMFYVSVFV